MTEQKYYIVSEEDIYQIYKMGSEDELLSHTHSIEEDFLKSKQPVIPIAEGNFYWCNHGGYYVDKTITGEKLNLPGYDDDLHKSVGKNIKLYLEVRK